MTDAHNSRRFANTVGLRILAAAALLAVCLGIAVALFLPPAGPATVEAQAAVYSAEQVADSDSSAAASPDGAAGAVSPDETADGESPDEEVIEEDETPQSSGLGGGEPVSGGVGFGVIAVVGIAAVALFFLLLMRRLNGNINAMNRMFK